MKYLEITCNNVNVQSIDSIELGLLENALRCWSKGVGLTGVEQRHLFRVQQLANARHNVDLLHQELTTHIACAIFWRLVCEKPLLAQQCPHKAPDSRGTSRLKMGLFQILVVRLWVGSEWHGGTCWAENALCAPYVGLNYADIDHSCHS